MGMAQASLAPSPRLVLYRNACHGPAPFQSCFRATLAREGTREARRQGCCEGAGEDKACGQTQACSQDKGQSESEGQRQKVVVVNHYMGESIEVVNNSISRTQLPVQHSTCSIDRVLECCSCGCGASGCGCGRHVCSQFTRHTAKFS
jgi:hypothetical protein